MWTLQIFLHLAYVFFNLKETLEGWIQQKYIDHKIKHYDNKVLQVVGLNRRTRELKTIYNYDSIFYMVLFQFLDKNSYLVNHDELVFQYPEELYAYTYIKDGKINHIITDTRIESTSQVSMFPPLYCFIENNDGTSQYDFHSLIKDFVINNKIKTGDLMSLLYYFYNGRRINSKYTTLKIMRNDDNYKELTFDYDSIFS